MCQFVIILIQHGGVYYVEKNLGLEGYLMEFREIQKSADTITLVFPEGWFIASASLMVAYYLSPVIKKARAQKKQENQQSDSLDKTA
jgi:hypothetical protein